MNATQKLLYGLTSHVDAKELDCSGATRLVHLALFRAKVPHTVFVGELCNQGGEVLAPPHFWVETMGQIIDYRAQMWVGPDAPHGVFSPKDHPDYVYTGQPTTFDLMGCLALEWVAEIPTSELWAKLRAAANPTLL